MNFKNAPENSLPLGRWQLAALLVAVLAAVGCAASGPSEQQFYRSLLIAFLYWWTITVGCLGLALLYQMTGGAWGYAGRPFFDAGIRTLPVTAVAFALLVYGLDHVYDWARPGFFAGMPHAEHRQWYLTRPFFAGRGAGYFAVCLLLGFVLTVRVVRTDGTMPARKWPTLGGLGAVAMLLVVTFAALDWGMSLDPEWFSTMYGGLYAAGGLLGAMCLVTAGAALTLQRMARDDQRSLAALHDLGKLLLALLMVWAYFEFSQFLIIYSGSLPGESVWYQQRQSGGWQWVALAIALLHFVLPFLLLLSADVKRNPTRLAWIAIGLAAAHLIEVFWTVAPSLGRAEFQIVLIDILLVISLGGFWLAEFLRQLKHRLIPVLPNWPYAKVHDE